MRDNKRRGGGGGGGRNFASLVDMIEVDENFLQYLENKEDIQGESTGRDSNPEPAKKKKFQRSMSINEFFLYRRATSCGGLFSRKSRNAMSTFVCIGQTILQENCATEFFLWCCDYSQMWTLET